MVSRRKDRLHENASFGIFTGAVFLFAGSLKIKRKELDMRKWEEIQTKIEEIERFLGGELDDDGEYHHYKNWRDAQIHPGHLGARTAHLRFLETKRAKLELEIARLIRKREGR